MRLVLPSGWAIRNRFSAGRRDSAISDEDADGGLFDEESGERMVGFDIDGRRGVDGRRRSDGILGIRDSNETHAATAFEQTDSNRRLSRELEEGFRDDSASEASDEEVTVGRRRASMVSDRGR